MTVLCLLGAVAGLAAASGAIRVEKPAPGVEARLPGYLANFLPYDPGTKVTVEKTADRLPGFQGYKIKRTGKYPKLAVEKTVHVSDDGKWFFDGDPVANPNPRPVQTALDLAWLEGRSGALYRSRAKAFLVPERDAAGFKAVAIAVETGFGPMRVPGYVTPDGARFLNGMLWDFQMDPREERKRRIDLSQGRFEGKPDGAVTIVEYADMECGYCRYRGTQLDSLLHTNAGTLSHKRYYKLFPLWFSHAWSMKAASAADCMFRFGKQAMFAFKKQVYSQQPVLTVSGIDELAVTFAEAAGIPRADFLGCYLRDESLVSVRKDLDEGQRLGVKSTPTYFVDGTEISWVEDKVMEDFLRTKDPNLKSISYGPPK
ncbi:MAG: thioredoxin domain-containing protein [Thermoanaerobaculia bacterium]